MTSFSAAETKADNADLFTSRRADGAHPDRSSRRGSRFPRTPAPHRSRRVQRLRDHASHRRGRRARRRILVTPGETRSAPASRCSHQQPRLFARCARPTSRRATPLASRTKSTTARRISTPTKPSPRPTSSKPNPNRAQAQADLQSSDRPSASWASPIPKPSWQIHRHYLANSASRARRRRNRRAPRRTRPTACRPARRKSSRFRI